MNDERLLKWAHFVATKFSRNVEGWTYSRDTGDLVHIRYKSDTTGYNHWTKRLKRALRPSWLFEYDSLSKQLGKMGFPKEKNLWRKLIGAWARFQVQWQVETNLPDGTVNGIITFWEEDGEYITLFGPTVGVKVIEFLRAEPENQYAQAILAEMHRVKEMSWPSKPSETPSE